MTVSMFVILIATLCDGNYHIASVLHRAAIRESLGTERRVPLTEDLIGTFAMFVARALSNLFADKTSELPSKDIMLDVA